MSLFKAKENVHVVYSGIWQTATILSVEKEVFYCVKLNATNIVKDPISIKQGLCAVLLNKLPKLV
jgi:hypothetical protein